LTASQVASNWAESFDALLNAYEEIGDQIPLLKQYRALFEHSSHMRKVLEMMYSDILEFHQRAIRFFSDKGGILAPQWLEIGSTDC
jgi:hypothetical protein